MADELTILIIEDDKYISNFMSVSLKNEGYKVMLAQSADEGLFLFSSNHPDLVLLDLGLPDKVGLEVIGEIRGISDAPVLVVSARGQEREKIEALDRGADDYISKPFHMGELLARVRVIKRRLDRKPAPGADSVFQHLIQPNAGASAIAFPEWMGNIHFHVFFNNFIIGGLRHFVDIGQCCFQIH